MQTPDSQEIVARFFEVLNAMISMGFIRGKQTFTSRYNINRWNMNTLEKEQHRDIFQPGWLTYLVRDYGVSPRWLLTGEGEMFDNLEFSRRLAEAEKRRQAAARKAAKRKAREALQKIAAESERAQAARQALEEAERRAKEALQALEEAEKNAAEAERRAEAARASASAGKRSANGEGRGE